MIARIGLGQTVTTVLHSAVVPHRSLFKLCNFLEHKVAALYFLPAQRDLQLDIYMQQRAYLHIVVVVYVCSYSVYVCSDMLLYYHEHSRCSLV